MIKIKLLLVLLSVTLLSSCKLIDSWDIDEEKKDELNQIVIDNLTDNDFGSVNFILEINNSLYYELVNDVKVYYKDFETYASDVEIEETNREDLDYYIYINDFINKILYIINNENYDKYVTSLEGHGEDVGNRLIYKFNTDKLIEDSVINEGSEIFLTVEFNLEDEVYELNFEIRNEFEIEKIIIENNFSEGSYAYYPEYLDSNDTE